MKNKKLPVVFLVCTGLGRINRGYESFTRECFDVLKNNTQFDLYLIKGGGKKTGKEIALFNLHRNSTAAKWLSRLLKTHAYTVEQVSFLLSLLPLIVIKKPAVIYYSDFATGSYLWHLRRFIHFKCKLLFANGAPNGPPYKTEDHVQQLLPVYHSIAIKSGDPASKHTLLPYAFHIDMNERKARLCNRENIRKALDFLPHRKIVLAVGAVNRYHKRMDYVINEMALLNDDFFLVILGQFEAETEALIQLAESKLKGRYMIKNLSSDEVQDYYAAADYFVLASLQEGFPRVSIEALSFGLPCIVHDYIIMRQVLQQYGVYIDMRFDSALSKCLNEKNNLNLFSKAELMNAAYNLYSWDMLREKYINMISKQLIN